MWHSKRHLFHKGLLSAVVDVKCGRAATIDFSCLGFSFFPACFISRELFQLTSAGSLQLCWGRGVSCLWSSSIWCCLCETQRAGHCQGSAAHKSGLPWRHLLPSTVTECAETDPKSPVLRVSEKLGPHSLQRKKLFFLPHWLSGVVFSWPNEDK